jgi:hypothetical protein
MKDGRTHLARKAEHAVDLETGAMVGITVQDANEGDTTTSIDTTTSRAGTGRARRTARRWPWRPPAAANASSAPSAVAVSGSATARACQLSAATVSSASRAAKRR